jgi:hypothetical protein
MGSNKVLCWLRQLVRPSAALAHYVAGPLVPNAWVNTLQPPGLELIPIALGPVGREKP